MSHSDKRRDPASAWESIQEQLTQQGLNVWQIIKDHLRELGLDAEAIGCTQGDGGKIKVVCVSPGLQDSVTEIGKSTRDQVVMVRVDDETCRALDAWVESGAVKSRSEAAAVFIREGLKVRESELAQLQDALRDVDEARKRLRDKAREVFGEKKK